MAWKTVKDNGIVLGLPAGALVSHRVVFEPGGRDIAYVVPDAVDRGNTSAALIAAAPRLRDACRKLWAAVETAGVSVPEGVFIAAVECLDAYVKAMPGSSISVAKSRSQSDREKDRERQRRCRARKATERERKDG